MGYELKSNTAWENREGVKITVITPAYNRAKTLQRTIDSIEKQTFNDWEYIIINDGSTDDTDAIIRAYLETSTHPVLYIKKENGGVHTARNLGFKYARGELCTTMDSDDEFVPEALEVFWNTWKTLPQKKIYREIVAQCMDDDGNRVGESFPDNINELPWNTSRKICYATKGEHVAAFVTQIMKENLFPEPDGVTFITENILWRKLDVKYCSHYTNEMIGIYHKDGDDRLSGVHNNKSIQSCKNALYGATTYLNDWDIYGDGSSYMKEILRYGIMYHILKQNPKTTAFVKKYPLKGLKNKSMFVVLYLPSLLSSWIYKKKRMN